jgi:hypothetical protein
MKLALLTCPFRAQEFLMLFMAKALPWSVIKLPFQGVELLLLQITKALPWSIVKLPFQGESILICCLEFKGNVRQFLTLLRIIFYFSKSEVYAIFVLKGRLSYAQCFALSNIKKNTNCALKGQLKKESHVAVTI